MSSVPALIVFINVPIRDLSVSKQMNLAYTKSNCFTDCKLEFPSHLTSAPIFNRLLKDGISFNQFEIWCKNSFNSTIKLNNPSFKDTIQYNIKTDIWGPKEIVMIAKEGQDYHALITYGIRDGSEFTRFDNYLKSNKDYHLISDNPDNRTFRAILNRSECDRELLVYIVKETEQSTKISLLLNFM